MNKQINFRTIGFLGPNWKKALGASFEWPEYPGVPCKEVYVNRTTGGKIVRRFNVMGELIFSNEQKYGYELPQKMY